QSRTVTAQPSLGVRLRTRCAQSSNPCSYSWTPATPARRDPVTGEHPLPRTTRERPANTVPRHEFAHCPIAPGSAQADGEVGSPIAADSVDHHHASPLGLRCRRARSPGAESRRAAPRPTRTPYSSVLFERLWVSCGNPGSAFATPKGTNMPDSGRVSVAADLRSASTGSGGAPEHVRSFVQLPTQGRLVDGSDEGWTLLAAAETVSWTGPREDLAAKIVATVMAVLHRFSHQSEIGVDVFR